MILLVLYLYQTLPQFIPKEVVNFQGNLLEKVVKELELSNPTTVPLSYSVSLEGPPDFNVPGIKHAFIITNFPIERIISIDPRGQKNLVIEFTGRFSKQVEARLTLYGKKKLGYSTQNSVMVFLLRSAVTQQKPLRVLDFQSKLYEHR